MLRPPKLVSLNSNNSPQLQTQLRAASSTSPFGSRTQNARAKSSISSHRLASPSQKKQFRILNGSVFSLPLARSLPVQSPNKSHQEDEALLTPATYLAGPKLPSSFLSQNNFIEIFTCYTAHHLKCIIHEFLGSHRYMQSLPVSFRTPHHCKQTMYPVAIILYAQPP